MRFTISEGYEPGCVGRIAALHAKYYAGASGFGVEFEAKVATELSDFCLRYVRGRDALLLARGSEIEGSIVIDGSHAGEEGAHLRWFITSDVLRGQGTGRELLKQALAFSDARGYKKVYLWTFEGLGAARHLYEAHGFTLVHQQAGRTWGKVVNEQRFERSVA
jgi:GNAT superfamily N-acetyltransferase